MPYQDKDQQREYQRKWIVKRREEWINKNGPCQKCGSTDSLEVDHIDPSTKDLQPAALWSMAPTNPKRITELAKCQVLCYDCHKEKTTAEAQSIVQHGSYAMRNAHGCKCALCMQYVRDAKAASRLGLSYKDYISNKTGLSSSGKTYGLGP